MIKLYWVKRLFKQIQTILNTNQDKTKLPLEPMFYGTKGAEPTRNKKITQKLSKTDVCCS